MNKPTLAEMGYKTTERVESLRKDGRRLEVLPDGDGWVVKTVQVEDRHEHGGLPDTVQIKTLGTRGLIGGWEFWPSATGALADITVDEHGHVTVTCHCARCEAARRIDQHVGSLVTPPNEEGEA